MPHKSTEVLELTDAFSDTTVHRPPGRGSCYFMGCLPVHLTPDQAAALYDFVHNAPAGGPTPK